MHKVTLFLILYLSVALLCSKTVAAESPLLTVKVKVESVDTKIYILDANVDALHPLSRLKTFSINPDDPSFLKKALEEFVDLEKKVSAVYRKGVAADGESKLFILVRSSRPFKFTGHLKDESGSYGKLTPLSQSSMRVIKDHFGFLTYMAPEVFDHDRAEGNYYEKLSIPQKRPGVLPYYELPLTVILDFEGDKQELSESLYLVPPPVVLMHGTYDRGDICWDWKDDDLTLQKAREEEGIFGDHSPYNTLSLAEQLRQGGFVTFVANYSRSNGYNTSFHGPADRFTRKVTCQRRSEFLYNATVVWHGGRPDHVDITDPFDKPGEGIKHALEYYRSKLKLGLTQVDVIGHSMGGVLPRVFIRGEDLPPPDYEPKQIVESQPGTMLDPSKGTEIEPLSCFDLPTPNEKPPGSTNNWYRRTSNWFKGDINRLITIGATHFGSHVPGLVKSYSWANLGRESGRELVWRIADWKMDGQFAGGAFTDQIPGSRALLSIGRSRVPAHAIAAVAFMADMDLFKELKDQKGESIPTYRERLEMIFKKTPDSLLPRIFHHFTLGKGKDGEEIYALESKPEKSFRRYAAAGFWNDYSDFTTSLESATGGLASDYVSVLPKECSDLKNLRSCARGKHGILHGYEPRHADIQKRIFELLKGGMKDFSGEEGFPEPRLPRYVDPKSSDAYKPYEGM